MRPDFAADDYWNIGRIPPGTPSYNPIEVFFLNNISPLIIADGVTSPYYSIIHFNGKTSTAHTVAHEVGHALGVGHGPVGLMAPGSISTGATWITFIERVKARRSKRLAVPSVGGNLPAPIPGATKGGNLGTARPKPGQPELGAGG